MGKRQAVCSWGGLKAKREVRKKPNFPLIRRNFLNEEVDDDPAASMGSMSLAPRVVHQVSNLIWRESYLRRVLPGKKDQSLRRVIRQKISEHSQGSQRLFWDKLRVVLGANFYL